MARPRRSDLYSRQRKRKLRFSAVGEWLSQDGLNDNVTPQCFLCAISSQFSPQLDEVGAIITLTLQVGKGRLRGEVNCPSHTGRKGKDGTRIPNPWYPTSSTEIIFFKQDLPQNHLQNAYHLQTWTPSGIKAFNINMFIMIIENIYLM